jgi:hypothetical protein
VISPIAAPPPAGLQRMGELRQHEVVLLPLLPHCTEAWILSYDPCRFRLKDSCCQCNTYSVPQPPAVPYSRYTAHNGPGIIPDSGDIGLSWDQAASHPLFVNLAPFHHNSIHSCLRSPVMPPLLTHGIHGPHSSARADEQRGGGREKG